ncbi:MAG: DUF2752 domain-containing protein [Lachnospiraceae bacterium]|nr:DUF2752 domain-containing protein [Lachnospiraceae bacterium]
MLYDELMRFADFFIHDPKVKERLRTVLRPVFQILAAGTAYLIFTRLTSSGIPCIFRLITGLQCPGCGMTRAVNSVFSGRFREALQYNLLSLTIMPLIGIYLLYRAIKYIKTGSERCAIWEYIFLVCTLFICLFYGIYRNYLNIVSGNIDITLFYKVLRLFTNVLTKSL